MISSVLPNLAPDSLEYQVANLEMARGKRLLATSKSKMNDVWPDLPHESDNEESEDTHIPFQIDYKLESFEHI